MPTSHVMQAQEAQDSFDSNLPVCYEVLLYLASRMHKLEPGETLEFITGDTSAANRIAEWCDMRGYTLLTHDKAQDGRLRFVLQK